MDQPCVTRQYRLPISIYSPDKDAKGTLGASIDFSARKFIFHGEFGKFVGGDIVPPTPILGTINDARQIVGISGIILGIHGKEVIE